MIRTVIAVLLAIAIVRVSVPALERGAATNSENVVERQVEKISTASVSLAENEQVPPENVSGPQRTISVRFPDDSLRSDPVSTFRIERQPEGYSIIRYRIEDQSMQQETVDAPIVNAKYDNTTRLSGAGKRDLRLELRKHNETAVVVLSRA